MAEWVRLCGVEEAPAEGKLAAAEARGVAICLARVRGELAAVDNVCPHRRAPLAEGWLEGDKLVCPWHSWSFDVRSGLAEYPAGEKVEVFALKVEGGDVLVDMQGW